MKMNNVKIWNLIVIQEMLIEISEIFPETNGQNKLSKLTKQHICLI